MVFILACVVAVEFMGFIISTKMQDRKQQHALERNQRHILVYINTERQAEILSGAIYKIQSSGNNTYVHAIVHGRYAADTLRVVGCRHESIIVITPDLNELMSIRRSFLDEYERAILVSFNTTDPLTVAFSATNLVSSVDTLTPCGLGSRAIGASLAIALEREATGHHSRPGTPEYDGVEQLVASFASDDRDCLFVSESNVATTVAAAAPHTCYTYNLQPRMPGGLSRFRLFAKLSRYNDLTAAAVSCDVSHMLAAAGFRNMKPIDETVVDVITSMMGL